MVLGSNDATDGTKFGISLTWGAKLRFALTGTIALRFAPDLLKPVKKTKDGDWEPIKGKHSEIAFTTTLEIDSDGNVGLEGVPELKLEPAMIGDSGFVIDAKIKIVARRDRPVRRWRWTSMTSRRR